MATTLKYGPEGPEHNGPTTAPTPGYSCPGVVTLYRQEHGRVCVKGIHQGPSGRGYVVHCVSEDQQGCRWRHCNLAEGDRQMTELSDTAKRLLSVAIEGNRHVERTNYHPVWWNEQFTITAGGNYFYEEKPNTGRQAAQAGAAVNELHDARLLRVISESENKRNQRFFHHSQSSCGLQRTSFGWLSSRPY